MENQTLKDEITDLINHHFEGPYWDFKAMWYQSNISLLHDIISMANNLENRDAYIIIGVDEDNNFQLDSRHDDIKRKNNNELASFLRDKKFFGTIRPYVKVDTLLIHSAEIDVITIKASNNTPFVLSEDFTDTIHGKPIKLLAHHVYTRINDSNTPKNGSADMDKVELLWRKRFGIGVSILDKMNLYLSNPNNWVYNDQLGSFFYKYDPLLILRIDNDWENIRPDRHEFFNMMTTDPNDYKWYDYTIIYNTTTVFTGFAQYLDGGIELRSVPEEKSVHINNCFFRYYYFIENTTNFLVDELFKMHYPIQTSNSFAEFIVFFKSNSEEKEFKKYMQQNINLLTDGSIVYPEYVLQTHYNLDENQNQQYIIAKKIKWVYNNYFLKN